MFYASRNIRKLFNNNKHFKNKITIIQHLSILSEFLY